ncbi:MAG: hypothetical protein HGB02_00750 [Chlorobiaceae bacterium]|nr:hypothetical protein [Chlorobiaceae bacterium]
MTTIIVLLCMVILLLAFVIAMIVTGWPGRDREEIERSGNALRREMAEHRSESIQLLHAIRIEVEDSVKESIEREMAGYAGRGRSRASKAKKVVETRDPVREPDETDGFEEPVSVSILADRQLPLFGDPPHGEPIPAPVPAQLQEPEPETVFVGYVDDIPDVD